MKNKLKINNEEGRESDSFFIFYWKLDYIYINILFGELKIIYKLHKYFLIFLYHFEIFKLYNSTEFGRLKSKQ